MTCSLSQGAARFMVTFPDVYPEPESRSMSDNPAAHDPAAHDPAAHDPAAHDPRSDPRVEATITRIRALLRKAERTEFPEEAGALLAKAQELITRHAIDEDDLDDPAARTGVGHAAVSLEGSYTHERAQIWGAVASANRCLVLSGKVRGSRRVAILTLVGRPTDRRIVELLAESLERQALLRLPDPLAGETQSSIVRRRRSYLLGFAWEISQRLQRVTDDAARHPSTDQAFARRNLVIRDELDTYVADVFTTRRDRSRSTLDAAAFGEGESAATVADLGQARLRRQQRLGG